MDDKILDILDTHAGLTVAASELAEDSDLYAAGMTSNGSVNVMLALEGEFDVEFPDSMLKRSVFQSIGAIRDAITEIQQTTTSD
jgi:acyl carrier protein